MNSKLTRRNLIRTIGASAVGVTTGCSTKAPSGSTTPSAGKGKGIPTGLFPRINLICHGMLLFLWKSTDRDHLKILVPASPVGSGGTLMHVLAFSEFPGGQPQLLSQVGDWSLNFGAMPMKPAFTKANSSFMKPMNNENVVFDKHPLTASTSDAVIPYRITVPYPSSVRRYKIARYKATQPPYAYNPTGPGNYTTRDHDIHPQAMTSTHVFTYNHADTSAITLSNPTATTLMLNSGPVVNLHIYSQPDKKANYGLDHIQKFNEMVGYTDGGGILHAVLDLAPANNPDSFDPDPIEPDLSEIDVAELVELDDPGAGPPTDPASCLQGWGC